jgi:hypothetical protein
MRLLAKKKYGKIWKGSPHFLPWWRNSKVDLAFDAGVNPNSLQPRST